VGRPLSPIRSVGLGPFGLTRPILIQNYMLVDRPSSFTECGIQLAVHADVFQKMNTCHFLRMVMLHFASFFYSKRETHTQLTRCPVSASHTLVMVARISRLHD
jgi:hypothetical protein